MDVWATLAELLTFHNRLVSRASGGLVAVENDSAGSGFTGSALTGPSHRMILPSSYNCRIAYRNSLFIFADLGSPGFEVTVDVGFRIAELDFCVVDDERGRLLECD